MNKKRDTYLQNYGMKGKQIQKIFGSKTYVHVQKKLAKENMIEYTSNGYQLRAQERYKFITTKRVAF